MSNAKRSSRHRKPTAKVIESTETWKKEDLEEKWCKVYCEQDGKTYTISVKKMEAEDSETLSESDLVKGKTALWKYKGKKYTITILEIYDNKPPSPTEEPPAKKLKAFFGSESDTDDDLNEVKLDGCISDSDNGTISENPMSKPSDSGTKCSTKITPKSITKKSDGYIYDSDDDAISESPMSKAGDSGTKCSTKTTPKSITVTNSEENQVSLLLADMMTKVSEMHSDLKDVQGTVGKIYRQLKLSNNLPNSASSSIAASSATASPTLDEDNSKYISDQGVNLLSIRALDVPKYALALMDAIFSDSEMARCCFSPGKKSVKPQLPKDKVKLLVDCIDKKYGTGTMVKYEHQIKQKCNQKCIDVANKRMKKSIETKKEENQTNQTPEQ